MNNIKNIKGIKRVRKGKVNKTESICVLTIACTENNTVEFRNRIEDLRFRLERIKSEFSKRGYKFVKTEWATAIIEDEVRQLEKQLGMKF